MVTGREVMSAREFVDAFAMRSVDETVRRQARGERPSLNSVVTRALLDMFDIAVGDPEYFGSLGESWRQFHDAQACGESIEEHAEHKIESVGYWCVELRPTPPDS